jgi:hypothetical protein
MHQVQKRLHLPKIQKSICLQKGIGGGNGKLEKGIRICLQFKKSIVLNFRSIYNIENNCLDNISVKNTLTVNSHSLLFLV